VNQSPLTLFKLKKTIKLKPHIKSLLLSTNTHNKPLNSFNNNTYTNFFNQKIYKTINILNKNFYKNHQNFYSKFLFLIGNGTSKFSTDIKSSMLSPSSENSFNLTDIDILRKNQK